VAESLGDPEAGRLAARRQAARVTGPLAIAGLLAFVLATIGYLGAGFGVLTDCTNASSCTETSCAPCRGPNAWLLAGGIGEWVLVATTIGVGATALIRPALARMARPAALAIGVAALVQISLTTFIATRSY